MSALESVIEIFNRTAGNSTSLHAVAVQAAAELARLQAIEAERDRYRKALEEIANGERCDNDGRGCYNESTAQVALRQPGPGAEGG